MKNSEKLSITVKRENITNPGRVCDFSEEIYVTDGKRTAKFIQHGEDTLNKYHFHSGTTANGVYLWTRHDRDNGDFKSDFQFIKEPKRWGKNQDKVTEYADILKFVLRCHELPIIHTSYEGIVTYDIINGKAENIMTDKTRDLFLTAYEAMQRYEIAKENGFPTYYIEKLKAEANECYNEIKKKRLEILFFETVKKLTA